MTAEAMLVERLITEVGPMATLLALGFYWIRNQFDQFKTAVESINDLKRSQEYTQACVSMIAQVQGIPLPERKKDS